MTDQSTCTCAPLEHRIAAELEGHEPQHCDLHNPTQPNDTAPSIALNDDTGLARIIGIDQARSNDVRLAIQHELQRHGGDDDAA